jgi:hypothetical protein
MMSRTARRLGLASLLAISALQTACPPPWLFWRDARYDDRGHHHGDGDRRHDDGDRHDHDDRYDRHDRRD